MVQDGGVGGEGGPAHHTTSSRAAWSMVRPIRRVFKQVLSRPGSSGLKPVPGENRVRASVRAESAPRADG